MNASYTEPFSLPVEDMQALGTSPWDALGVPPSMREPMIPDHMLPTEFLPKEEVSSEFDSLPFWPLSTEGMVDPARPYLNGKKLQSLPVASKLTIHVDAYLKTHLPQQFILDTQLPADALPSCSPAEVSPSLNSFPPVHVLPYAINTRSPNPRSSNTNYPHHYQ
jgi:hypothetical protein